MDVGRIAEDFVSAYREGRSVPEHDPRFRSILALDDMAHDNPEQAWDLILNILNRDQSAHVIEMLAAGPLEDLIEYHGPSFVERIEQRAAIDPQFRALLGGVWESSTPEVWRRILAVRGEAW